MNFFETYLYWKYMWSILFTSLIFSFDIIGFMISITHIDLNQGLKMGTFTKIIACLDDAIELHVNWRWSIYSYEKQSHPSVPHTLKMTGFYSHISAGRR